MGPEPGKQEQPIQRLQAWMEGRSMADREREVVTALVELARVTLRLDHRLNHIRDEADVGEPAATQSELRRAASVTTLVCERDDLTGSTTICSRVVARVESIALFAAVSLP